MGKIKFIAPGTRFSSLVVVRMASEIYSRLGAMYLCRCDCGEDRVVVGARLRNATVKACKECAVKKKQLWNQRTKRLDHQAYRSWSTKNGERLGQLYISTEERVAFAELIDDGLEREVRIWLDTQTDLPRRRDRPGDSDWRCETLWDGVSDGRFEDYGRK